jgi:hypothetical protein
LFIKFKLWLLRGIVHEISILEDDIESLTKRVSDLEARRSWEYIASNPIRKEPRIVGDFMVNTGYKGKPFDDAEFDAKNCKAISKLMKPTKKPRRIKRAEDFPIPPQHGSQSLVRPQSRP